MAKQQTLLEYLEPVRKGTRRDVCLATMMFLERAGRTSITAADLKAELIAARLPGSRNFNVSDVLSKAGRLVSAKRVGKAFDWSLTKSGRDYVDDLLGLQSLDPEAVNSIQTLSRLLATVADPNVKNYIEESLLCYGVNAQRAAVVFLWAGAIRHLQEQAVASGITPLNAGIAKHDAKARRIAKVDDFSSIKDVTQLLAFREIGMVDKAQWQILQDGLDLRNKCGHPNKYRPGVTKVAAFIEDVVGVAF